MCVYIYISLDEKRIILILRINTKKIKMNLIGMLIYKILNKNWLTVFD